MPKAKDDRTQEGNLHCSDCFQRSQFHRHLHFLQFSDRQALEIHLDSQYPRSAKGEHRDRWAKEGGIDAIIRWYLDMRRLYRDHMDAEGRPMPAWQAWEKAQIESAREKSENKRKGEKKTEPALAREIFAHLAGKFDLEPHTLMELLNSVDDVPF